MKPKLIVIAVSFVAVIFFSGCVANKQMYYWGEYSDTLYDAKKTPGYESLAKHKEMLENIVEESQKRNLRLPPGVCAELGYLYALQNNTKKAVQLFQTEKQTYPESTILMDRMIQQTEKRAETGVSSGKAPPPTEDLIKKEKSIGGDK